MVDCHAINFYPRGRRTRGRKVQIWKRTTSQEHLSRPGFLLLAPTHLQPTQDPSWLRLSCPASPCHQATGITEELYRKTYAFCTRLLTLPTPYCTVALDCAIRLKTEIAVPGESCWVPWSLSTIQVQGFFSRMP